MQRAATLLLGLFLAISGCTDAPASTLAPTTMTAAPPAPDADTGSVTGLVTDDEALSIVSAQVAVIETQNKTNTDAEGRYTLNGLAPGTYRLVFSALGYSDQAKKVEVRPGEVVWANASLAPLALPTQPYYLSIPKTSFIQADNALLGTFESLVNHSQICGSCHHTLYIDPGPLQVLVENVWNSPQIDPVVNSQVAIWWQYRDPQNAYHNALEEYNNRESRFMPPDEQTELMNCKAVKIPIIVGGNLEGISLQHRVDTWNTFAYLADLPEGFTALPPA